MEMANSKVYHFVKKLGLKFDGPERGRVNFENYPTSANFWRDVENLTPENVDTKIEDILLNYGRALWGHEDRSALVPAGFWPQYRNDLYYPKHRDKCDSGTSKWENLS